MHEEMQEIFLCCVIGGPVAAAEGPEISDLFAEGCRPERA